MSRLRTFSKEKPTTRLLRVAGDARVEVVEHVDRRYGLPAFVPRAVVGPAVVWAGQPEAFRDIAERAAGRWADSKPLSDGEGNA